MDERLYQQEFENANRQQIEAEEKRMERMIREAEEQEAQMESKVREIEAQEAQMEQEIARTVEREVMAALKAEGIRIDREEAFRTVKPPQVPEIPVCEAAAPAITAADILGRIDTILIEKDYIQQVIESINTMPVNDSHHGGFDGQARAQALEAIVKGREETNRKVLALLEKMYDDIVRPELASSKKKERDVFVGESMKQSERARLAETLLEGFAPHMMGADQINAFMDRIEKLLG